MRIIFSLMLVMLFLLPVVSATQTIQVNYTSPLMYQFSFNGTLQNLTDVSASIYNITNGVIVAYADTYQVAGTTGTYYYNFTPTAIGSYLVTFNTTFLGDPFEALDDILVVTNINNIAQDTSDVVQTIFATFIVFLVGLLIAWLAKYLREPSFYYFSAVYFIGSSAYMYFDGQGWSFPMFFALFGLLIAYKGISEHVSLWEEKQREKNRNEYDEID